MSAAIQQCPGNPGPEDICTRLAREIDELVNRDKRQCGNSGRHGLKHRFREQVNGQNGPGTYSWQTHDAEFTKQQKQLREKLDEFNKNNCGSKVRVPEDAWQWASRPAPQPKEWKGTAPAVQRSSGAGQRTWKYFEKVTGLTGAALVIYLVVSEGSRLFPPRNLVPVP